MSQFLLRSARRRRGFSLLLWVAALVAVLPGCAATNAVGGKLGLGGGAPEPSSAGREDGSAPRARGRGVYVVVDVDVNELRVMDGDLQLWAAPIGTGTDFRLRDKNAENEWEFSTPRGTMYVQYKEENPVWFVPDWYFVEKGRPIPPENSPDRRVPGGLGVAAVYLGDEIAIHGTDRPELLGQRVSHGCIRLANANAQRLFHNVQVGTPVIIVGKPRKPLPMPEKAPPMPKAAKPAPDPLLAVGTPELLDQLGRELQDEAADSPWPHTADVLMERGLDEDPIALRGLLAHAGTASDPARSREFGTFLADAYNRGALRTVVSLARISEEERLRAAEALVRATMDLYHGPLDAATTPWPTTRVPPWRLGPDGTRGWKALQAAEVAYREEYGTGPVVTQAGR